jgi:hypothetical protein
MFKRIPFFDQKSGESRDFTANLAGSNRGNANSCTPGKAQDDFLQCEKAVKLEVELELVGKKGAGSGE